MLDVKLPLKTFYGSEAAQDYTLRTWRRWGFDTLYVAMRRHIRLYRRVRAR